MCTCIITPCDEAGTDDDHIVASYTMRLLMTPNDFGNTKIHSVMATSIHKHPTDNGCLCR